MELRIATLQDWEILLQWRNDEATRKNSHNTDIVQPEQHIKWLQSVINNPNRMLYIAEDNGVLVGTVRADKEESGYELSWTIAPEARGKGYGKQMVKLLSDQLGVCRAEIKQGNASSVRIAEYAGLNFQKEENGILHYSK